MFALAVQLARLLWVVLAPTGAFGDWRPFEPVIPGPAARTALFSAFDPFNREASATTGAVQQVTSLPFKLYGIRINEGSGLGSAIIADDTGQQSSFAVGEEIMPGVTLKAVAFDHVIISRNGADETLYIDQSGGAPVADPAAPPLAPAGSGSAFAPPPAPPATGSEQLTPQAILNGVSFTPRTENGGVTGIVLSAQGSTDIFARAGFRPGDIVAQYNGVPIRSAQDLLSLKNAIKPGARLTLMVERGAATVPIAIIIPDNK
jgi:general secretion pathway protein C